jgi:hypothetical protein
MAQALPIARRRSALAPLLVAGIVLVGVLLPFYWLARLYVIGFWDPSIYLASAAALAAGEGYVMPMYPDATPNTYYPPGYSLLLAAIWPILPPFPESLPALEALSLAVTVGFFIVATVVLLRIYRCDAATTSWALLLAAMTPSAVQLSTAVGTDTLYGLLSLGAVALVGTGDHGPRRLLFGSACALAAYYTRSAGVAVLLALAIIGLIQARQGRLGRALALGWPLLGAVPWVLWTASHGGVGYIAQWRAGVPGAIAPLTGPEVVLNVLAMQLLAGLDTLWVVAPALTDVPLLGTVLLLWVEYRALKRWYTTREAAPLYLALYLLVLVTWPWRVPGRFVWPVAPLLAAEAIEGIRALGCVLTRRTKWSLAGGHLIVPAIVLALSAYLLGAAAWRLHTEGWAGAPVPREILDDMLHTADYVRENTPADAVLGTAHDNSGAWWWLYTGRYTLDAVGRLDDNGAFFLAGRPAGDPQQVTYYLTDYEGPAKGVAPDWAGPLRYCAPAGTVCLYGPRAN